MRSRIVYLLLLLIAGCKGGCGGGGNGGNGGAGDLASTPAFDMSQNGAPDLAAAPQTDLAAPGFDLGMPQGCMNGALDSNESDVDCGGNCPPCAAGKKCRMNVDCATAMCTNGVCAAGPKKLAFGPQKSQPTFNRPSFLLASDLTGDGHVDVAVGNAQTAKASLFYGDGKGAFSANGTLSGNSGISSIAAGDWNGDGRTDLALASGPSIFVYQGAGGILWGPAVEVQAQLAVYSIAAGDMNSDKKADLVTSDPAMNQINVFLNDNGAYKTPVSTGVDSPQHLALADFNGDGRPDVAVARTVAPGQIVVGLTGPNGALQGTRAVATSDRPFSVATADLDGDKRIDLVAPSATGNALAVHLGNGDGTFKAATTVATGAGPRSVAIADFDGDGKLDLAAACQGTTSVFVHTGKGDGTFNAGAPFTVEMEPTWVVAPDLDENGKPDLAVANAGSNTFSVLLNATP